MCHHRIGIFADLGVGRLWPEDKGGHGIARTAGQKDSLNGIDSAHARVKLRRNGTVSVSARSAASEMNRRYHLINALPQVNPPPKTGIHIRSPD